MSHRLVWTRVHDRDTIVDGIAAAKSGVNKRHINCASRIKVKNGADVTKILENKIKLRSESVGGAE